MTPDEASELAARPTAAVTTDEAVALAKYLVELVERAMLACEDPVELAQLRLELEELRQLRERTLRRAPIELVRHAGNGTGPVQIAEL